LEKRRFAQVGLGGRAGLFYEALTGVFAQDAELVALCDRNPGRLDHAMARVKARGAQPKGYMDAAFDAMIRETRPDVIIVTTTDVYHAEYICRSLELGCDVITEKPMTTDAAKCQRIIDVQRKTGRRVRVAFNYRYAPFRTQIKDLLMRGAIGDVLSVDFHWLLDIRHGADYFRRWHRNKRNSGGLLVHKATHHFDLVNWWLSTVPETVFARGQRKFYTPATAERFGLHNRAERCLNCPEMGPCKFYLNLRMGEFKALYLDNEAFDGYYRDRCVFSPDIDIEDSLQVIVTYRSGAQMSYSLNAFMPWEGYSIRFNGTKGRLEHHLVEESYLNADGSIPGQKKALSTLLIPHFGKPVEVTPWSSDGGHGGGDEALIRDILAAEPGPDPYLRAADQRAGAYSILTGIAANHAIESGQAVAIGSLCRHIGEPDFTPMPQPDAPLSWRAHFGPPAAAPRL
jgi:predicted dehydrogenase